MAVSPAGAADTSAPVLAAGTFSAAPNGNRQFVAQAKKPVNCAAGCPDQGAALAKLAAKGQELISWAKGLR